MLATTTIPLQATPRASTHLVSDVPKLLLVTMTIQRSTMTGPVSTPPVRVALHLVLATTMQQPRSTMGPVSTRVAPGVPSPMPTIMTRQQPLMTLHVNTWVVPTPVLVTTAVLTHQLAQQRVKAVPIPTMVLASLPAVRGA